MRAALLTGFLLCTPLSAETPIRLHPANPHYFLYQGKPTVLIASGEHYGAVLNLNFNQTAYLDQLRRWGLNLTRTFSGIYREDGMNPHGNSPLTPGRGRENYVAPWAWSDVEGGYDGRKFDLDHWNPAYFSRLRGFVSQARDRGVVVELVLFCLMYSDEHHWRVSPLHPDNNLQGEAWRGLPARRFLTLDNAALVARQKAVARKIVTELRDMPNVYFEVANEPAPAAVDSALAGANLAWHEAIINEIVAAEASLPTESRHMIAYNDHYNAGRGIGPLPRPDALSILNVHYLPRLPEALAAYDLGKALSFDETRWISQPRYPEYSNTMLPVSGRMEAWEFLLGGGAVYDNLNYAYQVGDPTGNTPESNEFRGYLQKLEQFVTGFDLAPMRQDQSVIAGGLPDGAFARAISQPGKQYGIYIHHGTYARGRARYEATEAPHTVRLQLDLPAGSYRLQWIHPADLRVLATESIDRHRGGSVALAASPEYMLDIALKIVAR